MAPADSSQNAPIRRFELPSIRVGLGFMRQSTDEVRDEARAEAVVHAALDEGVTLFDTAHAYGQGEHEYGHNERWLGRFLRGHPLGAKAQIVTKGGMRRAGPRYVPDGKAS
ncbi:MAG: aldo/keto reductase, partial [Myxococcota bacterium]